MRRPRPHLGGVDGVAVHVLDRGGGRYPPPQQLPGYWTEIVHCGGKESRCAREVLGKIPYIPVDARRPVRDAAMTAAMIPILEAEQLPDGSWKLGPGFWPDTRGRGPSIPLPARVWCPRCRTLRLVRAEPVQKG